MSDFETHIRHLHSCSLPVDLHADTPVLMRFGYDLGVRHEPIFPRSAAGFHIDLPRLRQGGMAAQVFALPSWPHPLPLFKTGPKATVDALLNALERAAADRPEEFVLVRTGAEIRAARAAGKIAGLRGIEGAHALEGKLENVEYFSQRGVIYLGLLHLQANQAGAPSFRWGNNPDQGLTDFGFQLVEELNRQHMLVDLAHINRRGFLQAAAHSTQPVLVSHTGVSGVHPHWRNIDDQQIRTVADKGGCIGVIYSRKYLGASDIHGMCRHLEHLIKVGGEDTPALGSDFDGMVTPPEGLEDISCMPNLTSALLQRGLSDSQISKILGENCLRVFEAVLQPSQPKTLKAIF